MRRGFGNDGYGFGRGRRANNPAQIIGGGAASAPQVVTHTYGAELWPQPTFAASTGLTLVHCTVSANALNFDQSAIVATCTIAAAPSFVTGDVYAYSITYDDLGGADSLLFLLGAVLVATIAPGAFTGLGPHTYTGTFTVPSNQTGFLVKNQANDGGVVSAMSLKKQLT